MKPDAVVPAEVDFSDPLSPRSPMFDDRYHAPYGAFEQASHVFLAGNGLPARWRERASFTILETGFGLGNNFLATWAAWRADSRRARRLRFISIEKHPLRAHDLRRALGASGQPGLAEQLCDAWPPLTPDIHRLSFDDENVELLLVLGEATQRLRQIIACVDAFYLDGFAPARNPGMWETNLFKALARLAAPGATAATWSAARVVRDGLQQAGFEWRAAAGIGGKHHITLATFAPRVALRKPVARNTGMPCSNDASESTAATPMPTTAPPARAPRRRVAIIGGGLAGASCAQALAREGLDCIVFDRLGAPAGAASGNVGGLFHGVFHPADGLHARAHRAAALMAAAAYRPLIADDVAGQCAGLVRLTPEHDVARPLRRVLDDSGLPDDYLQAWEPQRVRAAGGPGCAAWFYPGGGWIAPADLVRAWLRTAHVDWRGSSAVARLQRVCSSEKPSWRLSDADGRILAEVDAVVLANAGDALALAATATDESGRVLAADTRWLPPLIVTRGQVSMVAADTPGLKAPTLPIAGSGYALRLPDGAVLCGATTSLDDGDPVPRLADHAHNLRQLAAITGSQFAPATATATAPVPDNGEGTAAGLLEQGRLRGRVGWRATAVDRLPLIGAVPMRPDLADANPSGACGATHEATHEAALPDQPRHWPRVQGLFLATGLGSRGLTWAPLAGRLIAAWLAGAPFPLPADLVDALDPARFAARAVRASRRTGRQILQPSARPPEGI